MSGIDPEWANHFLDFGYSGSIKKEAMIDCLAEIYRVCVENTFDSVLVEEREISIPDPEPLPNLIFGFAENPGYWIGLDNWVHGICRNNFEVADLEIAVRVWLRFGCSVSIPTFEYVDLDSACDDRLIRLEITKEGRVFEKVGGTSNFSGEMKNAGAIVREIKPHEKVFREFQQLKHQYT
ncbi:MAG: hypothetical protein AAGL99_16345 [Pseudomonadota bacterium]